MTEVEEGRRHGRRGAPAAPCYVWSHFLLFYYPLLVVIYFLMDDFSIYIKYFLHLANLLLLHEVPYRAALILDKGMQKGIIKKNVRNLRLLSQAYLQAQESKKAIAPLKQAANLSKDGDLDVRLAQAYINLDRYKEAIGSLGKGLKKGGVKRRDTAYVMLGLANFELKRFNSSIKAFSEANKDKRSRRTASQWLKHVKSERSRLKQLHDAINKPIEADESI